MKRSSEMRLVNIVIALALFFCISQTLHAEKRPGPSHLMLGPGLFDVDRTCPKFLEQIEYRWEVNCYHIRPLAAFSMASDGNFFICGGVGYDIFLFRKKLVFTPSFAPGYYHRGHGKNLGFPLNFRSAIEVAFVFGNKGRFGAQFNHISNAHMFYRNPGANTLFIFYAIPLPQKKKG